MKLLLSTLPILCLGALALAQDAAPTPIRVTEGPILGRPAPDSMTLWVRTERKGEVEVFYGREAGKLDRSLTFSTRGPEHDYTGLLTIEKLSP
ncbi:MAG: alkaline phosphatase, partial [Verrucomicrobiota bacterium]|nr:alkaline phosphatase [Verrucomicrobiota bacterium]